MVLIQPMSKIDGTEVKGILYAPGAPGCNLSLVGGGGLSTDGYSANRRYFFLLTKEEKEKGIPGTHMPRPKCLEKSLSSQVLYTSSKTSIATS